MNALVINYVDKFMLQSVIEDLVREVASVQLNKRAGQVLGDQFKSLDDNQSEG